MWPTLKKLASRQFFSPALPWTPSFNSFAATSSRVQFPRPANERDQRLAFTKPPLSHYRPRSLVLEDLPTRRFRGLSAFRMDSSRQRRPIGLRSLARSDRGTE